MKSTLLPHLKFVCNVVDRFYWILFRCSSVNATVECGWAVQRLTRALPRSAAIHTSRGLRQRVAVGTRKWPYSRNLFLVARLRPPQTAACHIRGQRRQTRHASTSAAATTVGRRRYCGCCWCCCMANLLIKIKYY